MRAFPEVIDSSLMAAFKSCPAKAKMEYFDHWKLRGQSVHLHAGAAFATGVEKTRVAYYAEGRSPEDALGAGMLALLNAYGDFECPSDSPKSAERMMGALEFYFSHYRLGEDKAVPLTLPGGKRGIEFSFLEPLEIKHPVTGNPLLYSGRLDMLCEFEGMQLMMDDKTASQLGASWPRQWEHRSQFTAYAWGCGRAGIKVEGMLVRGISILKTKYDTLQTLTYRPNWVIDRWYEQLNHDLQRMIKCWEEDYFDYNLDHACNEYSGCPFSSVCSLRDPTDLLAMRYERREWNPVTRKETVL